jgi:hypothetical protein
LNTQIGTGTHQEIDEERSDEQVRERSRGQPDRERGLDQLELDEFLVVRDTDGRYRAADCAAPGMNCH